MVETQWRMGFNGPSGLDYASIKVVAESLGIEFDELLVKKLRVVEGKFLEKIYGSSVGKHNNKGD